MATRTPLILDVIRDRNQLYRELPGDLVENIYTIKIINQSNDNRTFELASTASKALRSMAFRPAVDVEGGGVLSLPVRARAHRDAAYGVVQIDFTVTDLEDPSRTVTEDSRFLGPTP